MNKVEADNKNI